MAIETVGQNNQSSFADPQNGTSPIDADEVTANDNALRAKHNTHDSDDTIHVQGSAYASLPAAGTQGRKWMTRDAGVVRLFRDSGSTWEEISYVPTSSAATITGVLTFSTAPVFSGNQAFAAGVTVGTTLGVTGASTFAAVSGTTGTFSSTFNATGAATFGSTVGVTGTLAAAGAVTVGTTLTVTGAATAASFSGSASGLTGIPAGQLTGTAAAINGGAITNLNGSAIATGSVSSARLPSTYSALTITTCSSETVRSIGSTSALLKLDGANTYFLETDTDANTDWITSVAPTGASLYLRMSINGVGYKILAKADS